MKRLFTSTIAAAAGPRLTRGCGSDDSSGSDDSAAEETTLTVYAASSLTSTFEEIGKEFEVDA